jgi:hypothetical protein
MSTTINTSNCDSLQAYQIETMGPSTGHGASSEISIASMDLKLSASLPLPRELRLIVYARLTKIVYRKLPIHHRNQVFIYWPYIGMPFAPACSSRQLHSDLQAYLTEVRRKPDVPDIIVRGHASPVLMDLLSFISMVAKMDSVGDKERQEMLLSRLLRHYAHDGEPLEGPKNLYQPHAMAAQSQITSTQDNTHPPLLISGRPYDVFDVELLHNLVCAVVSRLSISGKDTVHMRVIITDRRVRRDPLSGLRTLGSTVKLLTSDEYNIKVSVAKASGFTDECMKKIEQVFPANIVSRVDWRETTVEELAFDK